MNNVGFTVMQSKGEAKGVDARITAVDAARDIAGLDKAADLVAGTKDMIVSVTVIDGTIGGPGIVYLRKAGDYAKVDWEDDGSVIVHDINAPSSSTRDQVFVSTSDGFDRLEIINMDSCKQDAFAIGGFDIRGGDGDPIALAFNVNIVDGDIGVGLIGVTLNP